MNVEATMIADPAPDLVCIPGEFVKTVLPLVAAPLAGVVERSHGALSLDGIVANWLSSKWQMWVINSGQGIKAVMATEVHIQTSGRKALSVHFLTGEDSQSWLHLTDKLEEYARFQGCEVVDMLARKGWAKRLPDYKMTHILLEKELG